MQRLAKFFALVLVISLSGISAEAKPKIRLLKQKRQTPAATLFRLHPELKGSPSTLKRFNDIADDAGLPRIDDRAELEMRVASDDFLVSVPEQTQDFYLDEGSFKECLEIWAKIKNKRTKREVCFGDRRYLTTQALDHLYLFSRAHSDWLIEENKKHPIKNFWKRLFERRLKVTSLVRTVEYQRFLARGNLNAKQAVCGDEEEERDRCSAHVRGYAFDISAKDMKLDELLWIAGFLAKDIAAGKILAIYEYKVQANFHVMILPRMIVLE